MDTPHDCDTPDEIFFSSPYFRSCDMAKISSVIAVELYILYQIHGGSMPLELKLAIYWKKTQF